MRIDCEAGDRGWNIYLGAVMPERRMTGMIFVDVRTCEYRQADMPPIFIAGVPLATTRKARRIHVDTLTRIVVIDPVWN